MGDGQELYDRLSEKVTAACASETTNIKQVVNLIWVVVGILGSGSIALIKMANYRVASVLAPHAKHVTLLADRGFRGREWAELSASVGWRYRIRILKNTRVVLHSGRECRIDELGVRPGEVR